MQFSQHNDINDGTPDQTWIDLLLSRGDLLRFLDDLLLGEGVRFFDCVGDFDLDRRFRFTDRERDLLEDDESSRSFPSRFLFSLSLLPLEPSSSSLSLLLLSSLSNLLFSTSLSLASIFSLSFFSSSSFFLIFSFSKLASNLSPLPGMGKTGLSDLSSFRRCRSFGGVFGGFSSRRVVTRVLRRNRLLTLV